MPVKYALFITRILITLFLTPWVLMRFTTPDASKGIAAKYYKVSTLPDIVNTGVGVLWVILLLAFVTGFKKQFSYAIVLGLHTIGTAMTLPYLVPGTENFNILFMAALPTIGAMLLLHSMRNEDTFLSLN